MRISRSWLEDFVDLSGISSQDIREQLSLRTAEVDALHEQDAHVQQVKVAQILSLRPHPQAEKLRLVSISLGEQEQAPGEVVCGAPNIEVGMKVPFAPIGCTLPGNFTLTRKAIRGIFSEGMLCSGKELGLNNDHEGILALPESAVLGQSLGEALGLRADSVFEIENTCITHRPDLWGHYGIARELAALYGKDLKKPYSTEWEKRLLSKAKGTGPISLHVEDGTSCKVYCGISVHGVRVQPSPAWMQERLLACGLRPINNLVDIGNYVMLETAGPLHMFDQEKIAGKSILVRSARNTEELKLLDGSTCTLSPQDTVVADGKRALVLAGIMGGEESGISDATTSIFIEAANWEPSEVRRSASQRGLRTDSSQRFEKGLESTLPKRSLLRALELVLELCPEASVQGDLLITGKEANSTGRKKLKAKREDFCRLLGLPQDDLPSERIVSLLSAIEFDVNASGEDFEITVPAFRATRGFDHVADLVEEVGRLIGYENIPPQAPHAEVLPSALSAAQKVQRRSQDMLVQRSHLLEVISYPLLGEELLRCVAWPAKQDIAWPAKQDIAWPAGQDVTWPAGQDIARPEKQEKLVLLNPVSQDRDRMRPSLLPNALEILALNAKHASRFGFFEYGRVYAPDENEFSRETQELCIVLFDEEASRIQELLAILEDLCRALGAPVKFLEQGKSLPGGPVPNTWPGIHPEQHISCMAYGKPLGSIFALHPGMLKSLKVRGKAACAVLNMSIVETQGIRSLAAFEPLAKFPSSSFDFTVACSPRTPAEAVLSVVEKLRIPQLSQLIMTDVFEKDGQKFFTLRSLLQDKEQTLSSEVLKDCEQKIVQALAKAGYPLKT